MFDKMCKNRRGYVIVFMMACSIAMTALADIPPMPGALKAKAVRELQQGILNSLRFPEFFSFWLIWGGLVVIFPMSLIFVRNFLRVVLVDAIGMLILIIGLVTGVKNYEYCGQCGTKLEERVYRFRFCPKCSPRDDCAICGTRLVRLPHMGGVACPKCNDPWERKRNGKFKDQTITR